MTTYGRIQHRRDSGADWSSINPILLPGELGFNLTNGLFKVGDGVTNWNALAYFGNSNAFAALLVWDSITSKPAFIGAGATAAQARAAIGAASNDDLAQAIEDLVGAAPEAMDTLAELAQAWAESDADITELVGLIGAKQDGNANLTALAGLTGNNVYAYRNASGAWVTAAISTVGRNILAAADAAAIRLLLSLQIGTDVAAYHGKIAALGAQLDLTNSATNAYQMITYNPNLAAFQVFNTYSFGRSLLAQASLADLNNVLGIALNAINANTAYTLILSDAQKFVAQNNAAANQILIPTDVAVNFPIGSCVGLGQYGAGATTIAAVAPGTTTIRSLSGMVKLAGRYAKAEITKVAANEWWLAGALIA